MSENRPSLHYARTVRPEFKASAIDYNPTPGQVYIIHRLYKDGVQVGDYGLTQAASGVVQTWTPLVDLEDGNWTYTARAQHASSDGTWQHSPGTTSYAFRYDKTAPGAPTLHSATHPDNAPGLAWGATAAQGGQIKIKSSETAIAGYSYSWASATVPANSGNTCLSTESIGTTSGFVKATNGEANLSIPTSLAVGAVQSLWVKAIDQAGNQSGSVARYQFYITPNQNTVVRYEAESLNPEGITLVTESNWVYSGSSQIRAAATGAGQSLKLTFNVPTSGNWVLQPDMTKNTNNGIIEFSVNGVKVGTAGMDNDLNPIIIPAKYDQYRATAQRYSVVLDPITLAAGSNTITITTAGKHASSTGYGFTIDQLRLIKQ